MSQEDLIISKVIFGDIGLCLLPGHAKQLPNILDGHGGPLDIARPVGHQAIPVASHGNRNLKEVELECRVGRPLGESIPRNLEANQPG